MLLVLAQSEAGAHRASAAALRIHNVTKLQHSEKDLAPPPPPAVAGAAAPPRAAAGAATPPPDDELEAVRRRWQAAEDAKASSAHREDSIENMDMEELGLDEE